MLYFLFVILILVGIILDRWARSKKLEFDIIYAIAWTFIILGGVAAIVLGVNILVYYSQIDGEIASKQARYEALVYQMENHLYENDNDLGKKELYNEVKEWNQDLAYYKSVMDDFWIGIFYSDELGNSLNFIEYE